MSTILAVRGVKSNRPANAVYPPPMHKRPLPMPKFSVPRELHTLRARLLTRLQLILSHMQPLHRPLAILTQFRPAFGLGDAGEEARLPFGVTGFALGGFLALSLFQLLLLLGRFVVLL